MVNYFNSAHIVILKQILLLVFILYRSSCHQTTEFFGQTTKL